MKDKNVAVLEGAELDYLVAKHDPMCEGLEFVKREGHYAGLDPKDGKICCVIPDVDGFLAGKKIKAANAYDFYETYAPSRRWAQGGPIIERNQIALESRNEFKGGKIGDVFWIAYFGSRAAFNGKTPLIAAMRAFVAGNGE